LYNQVIIFIFFEDYGVVRKVTIEIKEEVFNTISKIINYIFNSFLIIINLKKGVIMELLNKKVKAFIVVNKDGDNLIEKIKNDPFAYILNEGNFSMHFNEENSSYLSYAFYTDYDTAEDFASWWTGNCGEFTQVREIEISFGKAIYDSEKDYK
jgi:hypothetical protein